jgi:hypothetical protein
VSRSFVVERRRAVAEVSEVPRRIRRLKKIRLAQVRPNEARALPPDRTGTCRGTQVWVRSKSRQAQPEIGVRFDLWSIISANFRRWLNYSTEVICLRCSALLCLRNWTPLIPLNHHPGPISVLISRLAIESRSPARHRRAAQSHAWSCHLALHSAKPI